MNPGASLEGAVEWGGRIWIDQVRLGLEWLGDTTGLRILDVGCRYGGMSIAFAIAGAYVVGVDVAEAHLAEARRRAEAAGVPERVRFERRSGRPDDLPAGFDVVFTKSVLVLSRDLDASMAGFARALNRGGRIVSVENARGPLWVQAARIARRHSLRPHGATYFTRSSVEVVRRRFDLEVERWTVFPSTVLICGSVRDT